MLLLLFGQPQPAVQVSYVALGLPSGWIVASQQVGPFTQTATGDVSGGGTADASASQTVGSFTQTATAQVWAQAQASQTVSAFGQNVDAQVWVGLQAAQTVGAFGQVATATNDSPVVVQAAQSTPGYSDARGRTYRVRVGKRWMTVDPLDAETLKAVYIAAEQEAERVAKVRVVEPVKSAEQVVKVEAPRVDYAGLAADAKRISEQVREVYAQALQRELIARLMREQMDREDDDAVLMLLLG